MTSQSRKYAVVDLEATSAGSNAKIIQVGIVLIENGVITQTYETDVNPHEPLDDHIKQLTGLTDARLKQAPEFSQVAREIYELIEDAIFVAHNVKFDANLLAESLFWEGFELMTPRVDTVELAQVFYPTLDRYNLGALAQELEIELTQAHSALADARATAALLLKLRERIARFPKGLIEQLLERADQLIYESYLLIEDAFESASLFPSEDLIQVHGLYLRKPSKTKTSRCLSAGFDVNLQLLGLNPRPEQALFAQFVEESLEQSLPCFIEAPTGIGKTYGYLLPALARTQKKVVVSVPTKILQDQIMIQEGKAIEELFHIPIHSLKSPKNYIKLDRFYESLKRDSDNRMVNRFKLQLLVWLSLTKTGDLSEIGQLYRHGNYVDEICHDGKLSKKSLFYAEDFWRLGQEKAKVSRLILTNHAYLLTRLEDDPTLVEESVLILDEAQKLFFALEQFSRNSLNLTNVLVELQHEIEIERDLLQRRLLESIQFELNALGKDKQFKKSSPLLDEQVQKIRQDLSELQGESLLALKELFDPRYQLFWVEVEQYESHQQIYLRAGTKELLSLNAFLPETVQLLFVSATISISRKVALPALLGLKEWEQYEIPGQVTQQQELVVIEDFPDITALSIADYASEITRLIEELYSSGIPLFILFTSKELMLETSRRLHLPHLAQYRNGEPANIKRRFDRGESPILLGTGSFWEGVDFSQQERVVQVITRLPFDNPKDLMVQKINTTLRLEGKNPFYDYSLPVTILRLKQAIGRTKRSENQRSLILLLDQRVTGKQYGKQVLESLRQVLPIQRVRKDQIFKQVRDFFR